jgi:hypothetical protein
MCWRCAEDMAYNIANSNADCDDHSRYLSRTDASHCLPQENECEHGNESSVLVAFTSR